MTNAMEKVETFIQNWNNTFEYPKLTDSDLTDLLQIVRSLLQLFIRLDVDVDAIMTPLPLEEYDAHTTYYFDLLPIINMTRFSNNLLPVMPQAMPITFLHFLQPKPNTSHYMLLVFFNYMMFVEQSLSEIATINDEMYGKKDSVTNLEDEKNKYLEMSNMLAQEKAKRIKTQEEMEIKETQIIEEGTNEKHEIESVKNYHEDARKELQSKQTIIEQKDALKENLQAEVNHKKSLRVYDAEDIIVQHEQARKNIEEADVNLNALKDTIMQKKTAIKNLHTVHAVLDEGNNYLQNDVVECLKAEDDSTDKTNEFQNLNSKSIELQAMYNEICNQDAKAKQKRQENQELWRQKKEENLNAERAAEKRDKALEHETNISKQITAEIKDMSIKYNEEKKKIMEDTKLIAKTLEHLVKAVEDRFREQFEKFCEEVMAKIAKM